MKNKKLLKEILKEVKKLSVKKPIPPKDRVFKEGEERPKPPDSPKSRTRF